jgi:plastocyanin
MNFATRRVTGISASLLVVLSLAGCGDKTSPGSDASVPSAESVATESVAPDSVAADSAPTETVGAAETEAASGSESAPADGVKLASGEAPAERTIVIDGETMTPNSLTIAVGENVTFKADKGTHAVIVGSLDSATVVKGLIETFEFSKPGTYPAKDDLTAATATITVK